jgi:hypothetical protein
MRFFRLGMRRLRVAATRFNLQLRPECGLENRCTGNRTVGSNPTLSRRRRHLSPPLLSPFVHSALSPTLFHHRNYWPIAAMPRRVFATELRRIEPGREASVEKERIVAAEAVAKKAGKLIKAHPALRDDEVDISRA